jgi:hypothetical protein
VQPINSTASTANREIAATISRLLAHFWTADDPPAVRQAQIEDWLEDLREFGPAIVVDACREWRRTKTRRPAPSEIRLMCIAAQRELAERLALPPSSPIAMEEYARSVGFSSHVERMDAIRRDEEHKAYLRSPANYERLRKLSDELALRPTAGRLRQAAAALGVTAREYTADELRAGRIALGLDRDDPECPSGDERSPPDSLNAPSGMRQRPPPQNRASGHETAPQTIPPKGGE